MSVYTEIWALFFLFLTLFNIQFGPIVCYEFMKGEKVLNGPRYSLFVLPAKYNEFKVDPYTQILILIPLVLIFYLVGGPLLLLSSILTCKSKLESDFSFSSLTTFSSQCDVPLSADETVMSVTGPVTSHVLECWPRLYLVSVTRQMYK